MLVLNATSSYLDLVISNTSSTLTGDAGNSSKESFSSVLIKNIVAMLVWLALSIINCSIVHTFLRHSLFYENPRYIMFICMVINDALQLSLVTALYVVSYIFKKIHTSVCCILIMTAVLTTRSTPLILAGMAVERYISICFPLHYSQMCTVPRTLLLICGILFLTSTPPITDLLIAIIKEPPSFFYTTIFCDHSLLFRDQSIYYKNCVFDGTYLSFVALTLVYTYCKIMLTARAASTSLASVNRARNTVLLHGVQLLLCMLAFVVPSLQAALISLFPRLSLEIRYIFFLLVYIIPRFLSPMIYGFRDEHFRKYWTRYLTCRNRGIIKVQSNSAEVLSFWTTYIMNSTRRLDSLNDAFSKNFVTFAIGLIINCINGSFVYVYFKSDVFQRDSRYVLYIHLVVNDMIMLTVSVMLQIMIYTIPVNFAHCCIALLILVTTNRNSPLNLAGMAVERYIAVCRPLHHSQICTVQRAYGLIALIWVVSFTPPLTDIIIVLATQPLSVFSRSVICYTSYVYNTPYHEAQSIVVQVLLLSFVFLTLIITYLKVFFTARAVSGSTQTSARNAYNTILLHGVQLLICMLSFMSPLINVILLTTWPHYRSTILFATFLFTNVLPRLLSPLIYGLRDKKFSTHIRRHFCFKCRNAIEKLQKPKVEPWKERRQVLC